MSQADVLAIAHQEIQSTIPDTLARTNALYNKMLKRYKPLEGGNLNIQFPVSVYKSNTVGAINGTTDLLDLNLNQNLVYGTLAYKFYYSAAVRSLADDAATMNSKNAVIEIAKLKSAEAFNTLIRQLSEDMYGTGTTANNKLNGFGDIFAASGTAYAGLNDTTYPSWLPVIDTTTQVINYSNLNSMFATLNARIKQEPVSPSLKTSYTTDLMISNPGVQTSFTSVGQIQQVFLNKDLLDIGFTGVKFNGVDWVIDSFCPGTGDSTADNHLYVLTSDSFHFGIRYGFGKGPKSPQDGERMLPQQTVVADVILHSGNMWCENRRVNGVYKTLSIN